MNKSDKRYTECARACAWSYVGIILIAIWMMIFSGCTVTYHMTDSEYTDAREEHATVTYWNNQIYWGWNSGYYYYYGKPHFYPWQYYYSTCPPSHYSTTSHAVITRPVNKPTHRPSITNRPTTTKRSNTRIYVKPNRNNDVKTNTPNVRVKTHKPVNTRRPK